MQKLIDFINKELAKDNHKTHMYIITTEKTMDQGLIYRIDSPQTVMNDLQVKRSEFYSNLNTTLNTKHLMNGYLVYKIPTRRLREEYCEVRGVLVDENGTVTTKDKKLLPFFIVNGYKYVKINRKNVAVHTLMSDAYFGGRKVNHIDKNKLNNKKENLYV